MNRHHIRQRFPRSLSEAFYAERAGCIEHHTRPSILARPAFWWWAGLMVGFWCLVGALV